MSLNFSKYNWVILNKTSKINELKGKIEIYLYSNNKIFKRMESFTSIQNTILSKEIKKIFSLNSRLKDVIENNVKPVNITEEEIKGYNLALEYINKNFDKIEFNKKNIEKIQSKIFQFSNKKIFLLDNKNIEKIFAKYLKYTKTDIFPLIYIPMIIKDFILNNYFNDGNKRLTKLLTLLLLNKHGFQIGKYISITKILQDNSEIYFSSINDDEKFINFFLDSIIIAYEKLYNIFFNIEVKGFKIASRILEVIKKNSPISKSEIKILCPEISQRSIERYLLNLQKENKLEKIGHGKNTKYILGRENEKNI